MHTVAFAAHGRIAMRRKWKSAAIAIAIAVALVVVVVLVGGVLGPRFMVRLMRVCVVITMMHLMVRVAMCPFVAVGLVLMLFQRAPCPTVDVCLPTAIVVTQMLCAPVSKNTVASIDRLARAGAECVVGVGVAMPRLFEKMLAVFIAVEMAVVVLMVMFVPRLVLLAVLVVLPVLVVCACAQRTILWLHDIGRVGILRLPHRIGFQLRPQFFRAGRSVLWRRWWHVVVVVVSFFHHSQHLHPFAHALGGLEALVPPAQFLGVRRG